MICGDDLVRVLVTGARGQLGADVLKELSSRDIEHKGVDLEDFDIADKQATFDSLKKYHPDTVIHCAAYTAVDKAEDEPELCCKVNVVGTENLAQACRDANAEMIYISTDYVFSGDGNTPYETDSPKGPRSVYGKSKLAGEDAVLRHLERYYIVRISWVFGQQGNNFVKTMLNLSQTREEINVVSDQIGSPTYTVDLAVLLCDMVLSKKHGIYHATNEGYCSWAEFAQEIMRQSGSHCRVNPISSAQYHTRAERPKNSRLSKRSLDEAMFRRLPEWKDALAKYLWDNSGHGFS